LSTFLSHNRRDKDFARSLGVQLQLVGVEVWFDEWEIRAGDSIPGKINEALENFDTFILVWSEHAAGSNWVRAELEAALHRRINDRSGRVIPVILDETPLPSLLAPLARIDFFTNGDLMQVVRDVTGIATDVQWRKAVQQYLDETSQRYEDFPGYGIMVGCPRCGAGLEHIKGWHAWDYKRDDEYMGAECTACGWSDGGEV